MTTSSPNLSGRLMSQLYPTVRAVARRYAHDADHAEDLAQECVVRIAEKWHTRRASENGTVHGWAWKVSENLCKSLIRTEHLGEATDVLDLDDIPDHAPLPDQQLEVTRQYAAVHRAVATLPARARSAIELVYFGELTPKEAANHLGVGVDAVRSMLVRGMHGLKDMLDLAAYAPEAGGHAATYTNPHRNAVIGNPVVALVRDVETREAIRTGLRMWELGRILSGVHFATGWEDLDHMVGGLPGCPVIVDLDSCQPGHPSYNALRALRAHHPTCPIIGHENDPKLRCSGRIKSEIGFVTILRCGECTNPAALRRALLRGANHAETDSLLFRLKESAPAEAHLLLDALLHISLERGSVAQLAKSIGTTARTLGRKCRKLGLPTPRRLLALAIVFHIERLARWARQRQGSTALALGVSTPGSYRRTMQRVLGITPAEITERGGPDYVADMMLRECTPPPLSSPAAPSSSE